MDEYYNEFHSYLFNKIKDKNKINFAIGQPDFKPPKEMLKAIKDNIEINTGYIDPEGLPELRELIKNKLRKENKIKTEKIIVTNGAIEAIFDSMLSHLKKDSEVILFSPYYCKYSTAPKIIGAKIKKIQMKNKRPNISSLEKIINKKTRMIVLNNPCNPTGIVFSRDEINYLVELVEKNNLIMIADEVYEKYIYDRKKHISPGRFSDKIITINSFSKSFGFPGLRLGYLAGSSDLINPIINVHMSNTTCSPYMFQKAAIAALKYKKYPFDLSKYDKRRKKIIKILNENNIDYIYPEGAFYFYLYTKKDSIKLSKKLLDNNVLVMHNKIFGDNKNAIRISYAVNDDKLKLGLKVLINLIK